MSKVAGHLVVFSLFLSLTASPVLAQCGVERWSVKTGTDPDAGSVNLSSSSSTTIVTMRSWTAPSPIPSNNRVSPSETTQWVLNATLTQYKLEGDSDYHLVLSDASGNTMIAGGLVSAESDRPPSVLALPQPTSIFETGASGPYRISWFSGRLSRKPTALPVFPANWHKNWFGHGRCGSSR